MHRNSVWLFFLGLVAVCTLGYTVWSSYSFYQYSRLTHRLLVDTIKWTVQPISPDNVVLKGNYTLLYQEKIYEGETVDATHYLNQWAAEAAKVKLESQEWKAWVDPNDLNYSTLQKKFPTKQCLSTLALWVLLVYLIGLGQYVQKYR